MVDIVVDVAGCLSQQSLLLSYLPKAYLVNLVTVDCVKLLEYLPLRKVNIIQNLHDGIQIEHLFNIILNLLLLLPLYEGVVLRDHPDLEVEHLYRVEEEADLAKIVSKIV